MFSENLKIARKQKGMSQEYLANQLHVVRQTISKRTGTGQEDRTKV